MWNTLNALWNLSLVRVVAGLANTGLNLIAVRDLLHATIDFSPIAMVIAVAWMVPWHRIARVAYRRFYVTPPRPPHLHWLKEAAKHSGDLEATLS